MRGSLCLDILSNLLDILFGYVSFSVYEVNAPFYCIRVHLAAFTGIGDEED